MGRCPECGEWNTLVEVTAEAPSRRARTMLAPATDARPRRLRELVAEEPARMPCGIGEFDRVLGGGLVPGELVLIGGDPGVGKSTLLMQVADRLATLGPVLYVSGEESLGQIALRARRLGLAAAELHFANETDVGRIATMVERTRPALLVVDSIQSVSDGEVGSPPGTVGQLRECALRLLQVGKASGTPIFLIGHVTKEGVIAGPRVLEHMVDAVLYLEGDRFQQYRVLRGVKNRFGSTNEIGVFEMRGEGMVEVPNPSAAFLAERAPGGSGSTVVVTLEGTRPLLVEVQALVTRSYAQLPRRTATGFDFNRLLLLCAVLGKRLRVGLSDQDIYVNVVGGLRVEEPAADLGAALAIYSSLRDRRLDPRMVCIGEVGLSGEVRGVAQLERRLREAAKLGFARALVPPQRGATLGDVGLEVLEVDGLAAAVRVAAGSEPGAVGRNGRPRNRPPHAAREGEEAGNLDSLDWEEEAGAL